MNTELRRRTIGNRTSSIGTAVKLLLEAIGPISRGARRPLRSLQLGITGTPMFLFNSREISGVLPAESFAAIIDEELGQAN